MLRTGKHGAYQHIVHRPSTVHCIGVSTKQVLQSCLNQWYMSCPSAMCLWLLWISLEENCSRFGQFPFLLGQEMLQRLQVVRLHGVVSDTWLWLSRRRRRPGRSARRRWPRSRWRLRSTVASPGAWPVMTRSVHCPLAQSHADPWSNLNRHVVLVASSVTGPVNRDAWMSPTAFTQMQNIQSLPASCRVLNLPTVQMCESLPTAFSGSRRRG